MPARKVIVNKDAVAVPTQGMRGMTTDVTCTTHH